MMNNYVSILDEILNGIIYSDKTNLAHEQDDRIAKLRTNIKAKYNIDNGEYNLLVDKLVDDKLISRHGQPFEHYNIHFAGIDFKKEGGYKKKRWKEKVAYWTNLINISFLLFAAMIGVLVAFHLIPDYRKPCNSEPMQHISKCQKY